MFQLKLDFKMEKPELPRDMDKLMVSFLKASLQNYSQELYEALYSEHKSIIKSYTFSFFLPGARFEKEKIFLDKENFAMFFSDADLGESIHFFNAFKKMRGIRYPINGNSMELVFVRPKQCREITDHEIVVKMLSSLIVRRHNPEDNTDIYYTCDQPGFAQTLKENVENLLKKKNIPLSTEDFSIESVKGKKIVASVFGRSTDASIGIYKLTGAPELLNYLYLSGIGSRRSEGHGKFEVMW
ncbi:MAG: CRISPR-associated endoribonuclease Cas6 [Lachnospiraceae bacterium]